MLPVLEEINLELRVVTPALQDYDQIKRLAKEAFPPEEYLAPEELLEMARLGQVEFLAIYDEKRFVGFTVVALYENLCYLFFLAIDRSLRSHGYGGKTLRLLEQRYPGRQQVVDFERIDPAAGNNAQRITRKAFYQRNGYRETGRFLSYLGVEYEILCKEERFDFDSFKRMMSTFRIEGFDPVYC